MLSAPVGSKKWQLSAGLATSLCSVPVDCFVTAEEPVCGNVLGRFLTNAN
ncbi:hypothetical protein KCP77_17595 [Salmonella enterica subsp. enterica]|nr:hypothetical protein KCP77_17595 [Salmonella enterica subsp. enterica]